MEGGAKDGSRDGWRLTSVSHSPMHKNHEPVVEAGVIPKKMFRGLYEIN